jgi:hypothetical protein
VAAELKVTSEDKGRLLIGRAPNGDTVVEIRRDNGAAALQTKNAAWRMEKAEGGSVVLDAAGATVARVRRRMVSGREIELAGGEQIRMSTMRLGIGHGCRFGDLADAKAPFLMPQRYFTLKLSDELLARPDRELLIAVFTSIADTAISTAIQTSAQGTTG